MARQEVEVVCPICHGSGKPTGDKSVGEIVTGYCHKCHGSGKIKDYITIPDKPKTKSSSSSSSSGGGIGSLIFFLAFLYFLIGEGEGYDVVNSIVCGILVLGILIVAIWFFLKK